MKTNLSSVLLLLFLFVPFLYKKSTSSFKENKLINGDTFIGMVISTDKK
jgi:hypothetical protein